MPIANLTEARDTILNHFTTRWAVVDWDNVFDKLDSPVPLVRYEDVKTSEPTGADCWVWVSVRNAPNTRQVTVGQANGRRFRREGLVTVQVFGPIGQGLKYNDLIANVVEGIFKGKSTGDDTVQFLSTSVVDIGESGSWAQTNVSAVFTYDMVS
jgi:hypothetical protein